MSILDSFRLDGKAAIVTGGDRGIGRAIAGGLAEAGADVVVANRDADAGAAAAEEITDETDSDAIAVRTDVTDETDVAHLVERTAETFGGPDVLVNNAGVVVHRPAEEMTREEFARVLDVNLTGVFLCSRAAGREMIAGDGGVVLNISSMSARVANYPQRQVGYNASKAGVEGFTRQLASEWAEHGIRVNALAPGYIRTEMVDQGLRDDPEREATWTGEMLTDEMARPEDLAPVALAMVSDATWYMTGETVTVDGGYTVR
jgi:NAD(P)-dependent dehydrogenase (short-subunit alcohol dehydrogenase family)